MERHSLPKWLLLVHQLPPNPTGLRVRTWRKLQSLGATPIKNSVYVLPNNEKTNEDFQWLKQEIESAGGEVSLFSANSVENATDEDIVAAFCRQRDEDYLRLIGEFDGLAGSVKELGRKGSLSIPKLALSEGEFGKLRQELERVISTDFFSAANQGKARTASARCLKELQRVKTKSDKKVEEKTVSQILNVAEYQNRQWVTRTNPHIDRLACGWLIKRFIDKRPRFRFIEGGAGVSGGIKFDMAEADFTHRGEDCSFETIIKSFGLDNDLALTEIAEIVHDIDLKDNKFSRLEAAGVSSIVDGLSAVHRDDNQRLKQCFQIFDAMYEGFTESGKGSEKRK